MFPYSVKCRAAVLLFLTREVTVDMEPDLRDLSKSMRAQVVLNPCLDCRLLNNLILFYFSCI